VDCNGVQQYAGSAIDGFLAKNVENDFRAHLERCKPCRDEIEMEMFSKHLVRRYVSWIPTPRSIQALIISSLHIADASFTSSHDSRATRASGIRFLVPVLVGAFVAAAFFFIAGNPSNRFLLLSAHTAENDIIHQSFETFAQVQSGQFIPAMVSSVPESVGKFFQRSTLQFGVQVPSLRGCDWCGGSASDNRGVRQAHVVYKMGDEWVYVCETNGEDALNGVLLSLPSAARTALKQSGWYTDPLHPSCNVVLWKRNNVVCVAVSTMGKEQLLTLFGPPSNLPQQF
jgi:hypothetical protein